MNYEAQALLTVRAPIGLYGHKALQNEYFRLGFEGFVLFRRILLLQPSCQLRVLMLMNPKPQGAARLTLTLQTLIPPPFDPTKSTYNDHPKVITVMAFGYHILWLHPPACRPEGTLKAPLRSRSDQTEAQRIVPGSSPRFSGLGYMCSNLYNIPCTVDQSEIHVILRTIARLICLNVEGKGLRLMMKRQRQSHVFS
ncbi:unnamed protein product [Fusarium fujikuroi]|nr:unnamed protein product [Fusarium fujikuroi]